MVCCSYVLFTQKLLKLSESSFVLSCHKLRGIRRGEELVWYAEEISNIP